MSGLQNVKSKSSRVIVFAKALTPSKGRGLKIVARPINYRLCNVIAVHDFVVRWGQLRNC